MSKSVVTFANIPTNGRVCNDDVGMDTTEEKVAHCIVKPTPQKINPKDMMWIPYEKRGGYDMNKRNGMIYCLDSNRPTAFKFVKQTQKSPSSEDEAMPSDIFKRRRELTEDSHSLQNCTEKGREIESTPVIVHTRKTTPSSKNRHIDDSLDNEDETKEKLNTTLPPETKSTCHSVLCYDELDNSKRNHVSNVNVSLNNVQETREVNHKNLFLGSKDAVPVLSRLVYPYTGYYIPYDFSYTNSRNINHNKLKNDDKREEECSNKTNIPNIRCNSSENTERDYRLISNGLRNESKNESVQNSRKTVIRNNTDSFEHYRGSVTEDTNSRDESITHTEDSVASDEDIDVGVESDLVFNSHDMDNFNDSNEDELTSDKEKGSPISEQIDDLTNNFTTVSCNRSSYENNSPENGTSYTIPYSKDSSFYSKSASQLFSRLTTVPDMSPPRRHLSEEYSKIAIHDEEERSGIFNVEDLMLRNRIIVILWVLLGEHRLYEVGFPSEPIHKILWRTVDICCSVAGMKSAAAIPLAPDHDCRHDMLCFRDHTHRFLEVCAPTRDLWKQFDWAGLTVDAVVRKIYTEEVKPCVRQLHSEDIPLVIQRAMVRMERLEQIQKTGGDKIAVAADTHLVTAPNIKKPFTPVTALPKNNCHTTATVKKKRGRPAKASSKCDAGRIERVMLWRFLLNLLEDPRNAPCIHWVQREEGIFRIVNTDWLARLWGRRHGNPRMTYEKMARAMRTYYRSKVLQPVPRTRNLPRKLVYKFNPAVVRKVTAMRHLATTFTGRGMNYNTPATSTS